MIRVYGSPIIPVYGSPTIPDYGSPTIPSTAHLSSRSVPRSLLATRYPLSASLVRSPMNFLALAAACIALAAVWGFSQGLAKERQRRAGRPHDPAADQAAHPHLWRFAQKCVAALMYVLGPIRLLRTHLVKRAGAVVPLTPTDFDALPPESQRWLTQGQAALEQLGFEHATRMRSEATPSTTSYLSLLEHQDHTTLATVSVTLGREGRSAQAIIYRSEAADGTVVLTATNRARRRFPHRPRHAAMVLPDVVDPKELLALHRFRVREQAEGKPPRRIATSPDPVAYQTREMADTFDYWVRIGYYRPAADDTLRLTPKGAVCLVWRAKFPWAQISDSRDARARELLLTRYADAR